MDAPLVTFLQINFHSVARSDLTVLLLFFFHAECVQDNKASLNHVIQTEEESNSK